MTKSNKTTPEGFHTLTAQLNLDDCKAAIEWYKKALGAEEKDRSTGPDGKIMHALLKIGDSFIMMNDAMMGGKGPKALGGSPVQMWIYTNDCDAAVKKAVSAGAKETMAVMDQFWGDRMGMVTDPHGYSWAIATHKEDLTKDEIGKRQAEFFKNFAAGNGPKKK